MPEFSPANEALIRTEIVPWMLAASIFFGTLAAEKILLIARNISLKKKLKKELDHGN